jgi:uncharacterized protein YggT (Ycf19 family)
MIRIAIILVLTILFAIFSITTVQQGKNVEKFIEQLCKDQATVHAKAQRELIKIGKPALRLLRKRLKTVKDQAVKERINKNNY